MPARVDTFDLASLHLSSGEGRRIEVAFSLDPFELAGGTYQVNPKPIPPDASGERHDVGAGLALIDARLDINRTTGSGYALRLRFEASLDGPCMRCLEPAAPSFRVDAREVSQPGAGEELESPYVENAVLDVRAWARDALALVLPPAVLCTPECAGLCPICGENLNTAGPDHHHERQPDPRWAKLSELHFE